MAKLSLFINITAPYTDVIALFINVTAPFINVMVSFIDVTAPFTKVTATANYSKDLVTLVKMYIEESKYSKENDNFDCKLMIFNNFCNRVNILQEIKIKGFPIILHSITFNFYYKKKATYITFNGIYNTIYNYFKGLKYKCRVLIK